MLKTLIVISMVLVAAGTSDPAVGNFGAECPDKFDLVDEYCLHAAPTIYGGSQSPSRPWDVMRKRCQDLSVAGWSVDLVIMKDSAKLSIINKHMNENYKEMSNYAFWVGARQVAGETSSWMWLDDTPVDIYSDIWYPNKPEANTLNKAGMLVPVGTEPFRLYMIASDITSNAPSFICEAVAE